MSKLLTAAIVLAVIVYAVLLSSLAGTYLPSKGNFAWKSQYSYWH